MINSISIIILAMSIILIVWRVSKISKLVNNLNDEVKYNYNQFDNFKDTVKYKSKWLDLKVDRIDHIEKYVSNRLTYMMKLNRGITTKRKYKLLKNNEIIHETTDVDEVRKLMKTLAEADKFYEKEFEYEIQEVFINEKSA